MHLIASLISGLARRLRAEQGFSSVAFAGTMMVVGLLSAAAFAAVDNDQRQGRYDQNTKAAYSAAEAGVNDYLFHLNQDNAYWAKCTAVGSPNAVNQPWNGTGSDPRRWRNVPGTTTARYAIELIPANGYNQCVPGQAQQSMIDSSSGTFRIRVTGAVGAVGADRRGRRSIIATFRRKGFLDYLYFTDYETADPTWYTLDTNGRATRSGDPPTWSGPDYPTWASQQCVRYWRQGRGSQRFPPTGDQGEIWDPTESPPRWESFSDTCTEIQFAPGDRINGPFHTNDEILVCGSPDFGRNAQDRIEASGPGWRGNGSCSGNNPTFVGTWIPNAPILTLPPSDSSLRNVAASAYRFTGKTTIRLNGSSMTVTNPTMGISNQTMSFPSNGVIYVQNGACGVGYDPLNPEGDPEGCGDAYVSGSYGSDLTIATEKDILVTGDITRSGDTMLGLIANNFVRIRHQVGNRNPNNVHSCTNSAAGTMTNVQVDAAILALQHSFTVDNYYCGSALGNLTINGVIAQKFRGPVGRGSGGSVINGYTKIYSYDDRLRFRSPPHFLDPVQSAWRIVRYTEQLPPR